mgnify:CR=1 FL=1|tara:strand:+ start:193 stop:510 length:318 start_codon:yes stop_codon:yes gene_type:complete
MDIIKSIEAIRETTPDISVKKLRAHLTLEDFTNKQISVALKELEITGERKSFKADFNAWLIEDARTETEAKEFIEEFGSENDHRQESQRLAIWKLAQDIRENLAA